MRLNGSGRSRGALFSPTTTRWRARTTLTVTTKAAEVGESVDPRPRRPNAKVTFFRAKASILVFAPPKFSLNIDSSAFFLYINFIRGFGLFFVQRALLDPLEGRKCKSSLRIEREEERFSFLTLRQQLTTTIRPSRRRRPTLNVLAKRHCENAWTHIGKGLGHQASLVQRKAGLSLKITRNDVVLFPRSGNRSCLQLEIAFSARRRRLAFGGGKEAGNGKDVADFILGTAIPDGTLVLCSMISLWIDPSSATSSRSMLLSVTLVALFASADFSYTDEGEAVRGWHLLSLGFIVSACLEFAVVHLCLGDGNKGKEKELRLTSPPRSSSTRDVFGFQRANNVHQHQHHHHNHHHTEIGATATLRAHHHQHFHHPLQLQQNLGNLSASATTDCAKCLVLNSPFRATAPSTSNSAENNFGLSESLEDTRSLSSGLFDKVSCKNSFAL